MSTESNQDSGFVSTDLEAMQAEFEESWTDEETEDTDTGTDTDATPDEQTDADEDTDASDADDEVDSELEDEAVNGDDAQKRGRAFRDMRVRATQAERQLQEMDALAKTYGFESRADMVTQMNERQLAQRAESEGVPVEHMRKLVELEEKEKLQAQAAQIEAFDKMIDETTEKYGASAEEVQATIDYIAEHGASDFESAYLKLHIDNVIERKRDNVVQDHLEKKRQAQRTSNAKVGGGTQTLPQKDDVLTDDEFKREYDRIFGG